MQIAKMGIILMVVTIAAAFGLAMVNSKTAPVIAQIKAEKAAEARYAVLPGSREGIIVPVSEGEKILYYKGYTSSDTTGFIGYAAEAAGSGYSGTIKSVVGVNADGSIISIKILEQTETPGLGTKIVAEGTYQGKTMMWFEQFAGRFANGLAVDKDGGEIASVTGATISSRATTKAVKAAVQALEETLGGFKAAVTDSASPEEGGAQ